jgi:hypothetical protein
MPKKLEIIQHTKVVVDDDVDVRAQLIQYYSKEYGENSIALNELTKVIDIGEVWHEVLYLISVDSWRHTGIDVESYYVEVSDANPDL